MNASLSEKELAEQLHHNYQALKKKLQKSL